MMASIVITGKEAYMVVIILEANIYDWRTDSYKFMCRTIVVSLLKQGNTYFSVKTKSILYSLHGFLCETN